MPILFRITIMQGVATSIARMGRLWRRALSASLGRQLVSLHRRIADTRSLQDTERLAHVATGRAFAEIILGPERRQLLRDCDVDELIERDALGFRQLAELVQQRRLKPKREIALPHDRPSRAFTASPGAHTTIPNRAPITPKSRWL